MVNKVYMITSSNIFGQTFVEALFATRERAEKYLSNATVFAVDNQGNPAVWRHNDYDLVLDIREVIE